MDNNNNKNCRNYVMKDFSKKFNLNRRSPKKSLGQSNNLITNSCNDFIKITNNFFLKIIIRIIVQLKIIIIILILK